MLHLRGARGAEEKDEEAERLILRRNNGARGLKGVHGTSRCLNAGLGKDPVISRMEERTIEVPRGVPFGMTARYSG